MALKIWLEDKLVDQADAVDAGAGAARRPDGHGHGRAVRGDEGRDFGTPRVDEDR